MAKPWPLATHLTAELVAAADGPRHGVQWADLAARALEPNVFHAPAMAIPALRHLPEGRGAQLLLAWRGEGETRRLVGLLPLVRARGRHLNPLATRRAASLYGTVSTPLIDPDRPAETLGAMLNALGASGIATLILPYLHAEGPVAAALREAGAAGPAPLVRLDEHRRAFLRSPLAGAAYLKATLESRRRKEADRQRRRLAELGPLAFTMASAPGEVAAALEEFLELETAGWKGRSGTALALAPGAAPFIREAARSGAAAGTFRVAALRLDGRAVAIGLVGIAGRRAFYMKTAYDEALSRFSPGLLMTLDLTVRLLDDAGLDDADSIAVADHPMIDRVWTERFPVESVAVATRPGGGRLFACAVAIERGREHAVERLKAGSARLRRWRERGGKDAGGKPAPEAAASRT